MIIEYKPHNTIDLKKWDGCIKRSVNGIIYCYSWYLNAICPQWDALILGDYDVVMPLTWNKKFRIFYLFQPNFTQQLGVFSPNRLTPELIDSFIQSIPEHFKFCSINLNTFNHCTLTFPDISERLTYELDLIEPYEKLCKKYSTNLSRNIKYAHNQNIKITSELTVDDLISFKRKNQIVKLKSKSYQYLRGIAAQVLSMGLGKIYGAYTKKGELCAITLFVITHNKAIYLVSSSNAEGKKNRAMPLLIDQFIKEHAGTNLTLDFEGSMISTLARFFQSFGAKPCYYQNIKINNLPWWIRALKS